MYRRRMSEISPCTFPLPDIPPNPNHKPNPNSNSNPNINPTNPNPTDHTLALTLLSPLLTLTLAEQGRGNILGGIVQRELSVSPAAESAVSRV